MHKSKLIQVLKMLDSAEMKRLFTFLKSPFFNSNPHLVKLYLLLRKDHPDFNSPKLSMPSVFKKLFPKRDYDHQKLLNLMSDFTRLLKVFLQHIQLAKEEAIQDRLLLQAYAERPHHYESFVREVRKKEKQLDKLAHQDAEYHQQKYWLSQLYFKHPGTDNFQLSKAEYDASMQHLDRWFQLEKLWLSCEMKAREKPLSEHYDIWLLKEMREEIGKAKYKSPITEAYGEMLNLMEKGEAAAYYNLKILLMQQSDRFTRQQQQDMLQGLINYAIRNGNRGQVAFLRENLELYQFGLQEQHFIEHGVLDDMTYISMVNIALRTGASDWCWAFIREYEALLEPMARKDAKSLATALWLYAAQKPEETIQLLQKVEFLNVYYQIQARVLLIKIHFEAFRKDETYFELLFSQAEAFERFLRRNNKVSKGQKEGLLNFILSIKQLAKLKSGNALHKKVKAKLVASTNGMTPFYNKSWFLKQIG